MSLPDPITRTIRIACLLCLVAVGIHAATRSDAFHILLNPSGQVSFAPTIYGHARFSELNPGYRADLFLYVDIFRWRKWIFDFYTANTTLIARDESTLFTLDRIRYTLSPGFRYPFRKWIITGLLFHECIHTISRPEKSGSTYWNTIRIGGGTKGAYHFYLVDKYITRDFTLRNSFDARVDIDLFMRGHVSRWIAQNHHYRFGEEGLLRYHFELFGVRLFADLFQNAWFDDDKRWTKKWGAALHLALLGRANMSTLYFRHVFMDDNPHDNEHGLGAVGFRMIF